LLRYSIGARELESLQRLFKTLDLTNFDAKVYVTLLTLGPSSPSRLVEELASHRPQIHGSLKRLASKGLVEVYSGRPAMYRAVPPDLALSIIESELVEDLEEAKRFLGTLRPGEANEEHGVWLYKSSKGLMNRYIKTVSESQIDLLVCGDPEFIEKLHGHLLEAQDRGVLVYVIVYEIPGVKFQEEQIEGLKKVKRAVSGDLMVVADSNIGVLSQRRLGASVFPGYGVVVEEPVLIDYLQQDFLYRWMRSKTVVNEPVRLPVRFTMFKLALLEVQDLLASGVKIWGHFKGRWVHDSKGEFEGEIVKTIHDLETGIAQMLVITDDGNEYTVGGPDAIVEDFAVEEVYLKRVR